MKYNFISFLFLASSFLIFYSCDSTEVIPTNQIELANLNFDYNIPEMNTNLDNDVVKLGRVLFYDPILSKNGVVSCASCHKQEFSFSDNVAFSEGFLEGLTTKNTPHLLSLGEHEVFTWDGSFTTTQEVAINPVFNRTEMGLSFNELNTRINNASYYTQLIEDAFERSELTFDLIAESLAQFVESIIPTQSRQQQAEKGLIQLNTQEENGKQIFALHCASCHQVIEPAHEWIERQDLPVADIGLPLSGDLVRNQYHTSKAPRNAVQRIPNLWNISNTNPYMHDGRFNTLAEVIDHYINGIDNRESVSTQLKFGINISDSGEIDDLISFLEALDDNSIREDLKFSNPFIN